MGDTVKGKVAWKFDDNFNADLIVGSRYIEERDPEVLGRVCLADFDPEFSRRVKPGDIVVAGRNFGYGHPHYQGLMSLKTIGISILIAESIYPVWYRMAIFYAFPVLECAGIAQKVNVGDELGTDIESGVIKNLTSGDLLQGQPMPKFLIEIVKARGLVPYLRERLSSKSG